MTLQRGVLLDIEGTTSSVRFVYDQMFPFARRRLGAYLAAAWGTPAVEKAAELLARDAGHASFAAWQAADPGAQGAALAEREALRLMDADAKATGLKELQGLVWEEGFRSGALRAHVYPDVPPALRAWRAAGVDLRIYSSGSVHAQKLFFAHTEAGDLTPLLSGHYDTTTGPKREAESYRRIAADWGLEPARVLFLSDIPAELDAARAAGMHATLVVRPDNAPASPGDALWPTVHSFAEIETLPF